VRFVVEGTPAPQGSKKAFVVKGPKGPRAVLIDDDKQALKVWRKLVEVAALQAMLHPISPFRPIPAQVAVKVEIEFRVLRPASVSEDARPFPSVRPDVDKYARAALDALTTAGIYTDDGQVVDLHVTKVYADAAGAAVGVWEFEKGTTE
jgi:Holliday junction resolvase RusA-like endonuclease